MNSEHCAVLGPLTGLSFRRTNPAAAKTSVPQPPTNEERYRALLMVLPLSNRNEHPWPFQSPPSCTASPQGESPLTAGPADAAGQLSEAKQYAAEQSPPDEGYFHNHTYTELTGGF